MGLLVGLGTSIVFQLPLSIGIKLCFWLAFTWSLSSMIGWARHKTFQRGIRGYIAYGAIPNAVMGMIVFGFSQPIPIILLSFVGGLGMGIGFALSYPLLKFSREKINKKYQEEAKEMLHGREIAFGDIPEDEKDQYVHFIHLTKFDTWKFLMEISSGLLYGLTTIIILAIYEDNVLNVIILIVKSPSFTDYLYASLVFVLLWMGLFINCFSYKSRYNVFWPKEEQKPWSEKKKKRLSLFIIGLGTIYGIILLLNLENIKWDILFLFLYWSINISGRIRHHLNTPLFRMDMYVDFIYGIIISILLIFFV